MQPNQPRSIESPKNPMKHRNSQGSIFTNRSLFGLLAILGLLIGCLWVSEQTVLAQDAAANNAAPAAGQANEEVKPPKNLLAWTYEALGLKYTLAFLALSFVAVGLLVMNILAVRRDSICPSDLVDTVEQNLAEKNFEGAAELIRSDDSFLGQVLAAGLGKLEKGYDHAIEAMQITGEEETMKVEHRLGYMALIGNVAPMVGLLGTVEGMVAAFTVIASRTTTPPPSELAKGISTALVTTLIGLYLAIPAIAIYNLLRNKFQRLVLEVGNTSEDLLEKFEQSVRK